MTDRVKAIAATDLTGGVGVETGRRDIKAIPNPSGGGVCAAH